MKPAHWLLTAAVAVLNAAGNFALAWGMKRAPEGAGLVLPLVEPAVVAGIVLLIGWVLLRLKLLGLADLSFVLPVTAVGYVLNAFMGMTFLGEHVSAARWTGTLLIVGGAALAGATAGGARPAR
jgi:uncharacterized membrane protein